MVKRIAIAFVVLLAATMAFAHDHGKSCDMGKAGKSVELTGTLTTATDMEHGKSTFKVANGDTTYTVCEMSDKSALKLGNGKDTLHVKGKLVQCEGSEKLLIESATKE